MVTNVCKCIVAATSFFGTMLVAVAPFFRVRLVAVVPFFRVRLVAAAPCFWLSWAERDSAETVGASARAVVDVINAVLGKVSWWLIVRLRIVGRGGSRMRVTTGWRIGRVVVEVLPLGRGVDGCLFCEAHL